MERLTRKEPLAGHVVNFVEEDNCFDVWSVPKKFMGAAIDRLASIEDILGDDYDLDRLRELVEADREGRCIVAPVKPGGFVRFKGNPRAPHEKVDCINIYTDGKIMLAFHAYGVKETFVDDWSEDEAEKYISVEEE